MDSQQPAAGTRRYDWRLFRLLISPSWISALSCTLIAIAITTVLLIQGHYEGSELQRQFLAWQQDSEGGTLYQAVMGQQYTTISKVVSTIQLFIFWYVVGLFLYVLASAGYTAIQEIRQLKNNLAFVNANPGGIVRNMLMQIFRQLGALFTWLLLATITLKTFIPYALGTIHIASEYLPAPEAIGILLAITFAMAFCLHLHIILIRLFLGRPRIWHSEEYIQSL